MGGYHAGLRTINRGETLHSLRERLHSLNMRLLLAMQNRDEDAQKDLEKQMAAVQLEIGRMCQGGGCRR